MDWDVARPTQQIANLTRDTTQGTEIWANISGTVEESLANFNRITPVSDLDNPGIITKSSKTTLDFAVSPQATRHVHAEAMGIQTSDRIRGRGLSFGRGTLCRIRTGDVLASLTTSASLFRAPPAVLASVVTRRTCIPGRRRIYFIFGPQFACG